MDRNRAFTALEKANREGATKAVPAGKRNAAGTYNEFIRDPHRPRRCKVAAINFTTLNNNIYGR